MKRVIREVLPTVHACQSCARLPDLEIVVHTALFAEEYQPKVLWLVTPSFPAP
jgi:hypothetical protein